MLLAGLAWDEAESSEEPSLIHLERPSMEVGSDYEHQPRGVQVVLRKAPQGNSNSQSWAVSCKSCPEALSQMLTQIAVARFSCVPRPADC